MQLTTLITKLGARAREEHGVTMLLALFVLVITTLILGVTYVAVLNDTGLSRNDLDQKRAYAAAQAGIQAYNYQLNQNESYWQTCTPLGSTGAAGFDGVNGKGFVTVPGSTDAGGGSESYFVKPLPATTAPANDNQCDQSNPLSTMIEGPASGIASGSFRISSTGHSGNATRTIVAQYKPPSFLDYVYYTDYETLDPAALYNPNKSPAEPTDCEVHYPNRGGDCGGAINFITGDTINGPIHSEDTLAICGNPVFGRSGGDDAVQAAASSPTAPGGWYSSCTTKNPNGSTNLNASPVFNTPSHAINTSSTSITPPPSNTSLLSVAQPTYHFTGRTTIVLSGSEMYVTNAAADLTGTTPMQDPSNGVVYVSTASSGCPVVYTPFNPSYTADTNCGNVYVRGTYSVPLTIASDNDIIINGNICTTTTCSGTPTTNAMLGLIANDFVRIYHPVSGSASDIAKWCNAQPPTAGTDPVTNASGYLPNPVIYAAILAVNHSFIVDNYDCGGESPSLGDLDVYGAIAQLFRGPVGTDTTTDNGNGTETISTANGYDKSYNYDDRLANEEPPYFLNPVAAQWFVSRETECDGSSC